MPMTKSPRFVDAKNYAVLSNNAMIKFSPKINRKMNKYSEQYHIEKNHDKNLQMIGII